MKFIKSLELNTDINEETIVSSTDITPNSIRDYISVVETYSKENSWLRNYMKDKKFDPYTNWWFVCDWLEKNDHLKLVSELLKDDIQSGDDLESNYDPDVFYQLPDRVQEKCGEEVVQYLHQHDPAHAPTWSHSGLQDNKLLDRNTWLIHFSDDANQIAYNGFQFGIEDMDSLGLTTYLKKNGEGYNFAFIADSRDAYFSSRKKSYGKNAVMFRSSGVNTNHYGDEEQQIIFWGPDVNPKDIVYLKDDGGDWKIMSKNSSFNRKRDYVFTGEFKTVVNWVEKNFDQYRNILTGK